MGNELIKSDAGRAILPDNWNLPWFDWIVNAIDVATQAPQTNDHLQATLDSSSGKARPTVTRTAIGLNRPRWKRLQKRAAHERPDAMTAELKGRQTAKSEQRKVTTKRSVDPKDYRLNLTIAGSANAEVTVTNEKHCCSNCSYCSTAEWVERDRTMVMMVARMKTLWFREWSIVSNLIRTISIVVESEVDWKPN